MPDKNDFAVQLGGRIAAARKEAHYSQAKLAERLDMSGNGLGSYEQGRAQPTPEVLKSIAHFTGTSVEVLVGATPPEGVARDSAELKLLARWREMDAETKLRMMVDFGIL